MITIRLIKPLKQRTIEYSGRVLTSDSQQLIIQTEWTTAAIDLGIFSFAPGDQLIEYFYTERWYTIFELFTPDWQRKGWYCNISRPALIQLDLVQSEDLELDLLVSADRSSLRLDDEDEFAARNLRTEDPAAYTAAWAAIDELHRLIAQGAPPFDQSRQGIE